MRRFSQFLILFSAGLTMAGAQTNFGSVNIGSSTTSTVTLTVATAGTVGSIAVVTQGATGLDFTNAGTGTCATGTTYAVGATCTVAAKFKPLYAGTRYGAVVLKDGSGNVLATTPIYGIGTGPQVTFHPGTQTTPGSGFSGPWRPASVAVDASGNVYVSVAGFYNFVEEILGSGGYTTTNTLGNGFGGPYGVAVDGSGNVFVADSSTHAVKEILASGGYTTVKTLGSGFNNPYGVAVDGSGNVFVADVANSAVYEILASGGYTTVNALGGGFSQPYSVAVDGSGNVFVADWGNKAVKEILAVGGYTAVNTLGSGFNRPSGVALDGGGNVYVTDSGNYAVYEILAAGGYTTVHTLGSGWSQPTGVAVDGSGNVFVVDPGHDRVVKLDLADPPALSFASTFENQTSADSPQTVQVQNVGNQALTFSGLSYPADFPEASGDPNDCTGSTSLSAGQQCDISIDFTPLNVGLLNENVILTYDALNMSAAQQSIGVSGTGISLTTVSLSATSLSFGGQLTRTASATQQVTLTNTGSNTLFLSSIGVTGAGASSFVFTNTCGASLAAGASCTIQGYFWPWVTGAVTAAVTIVDNVNGSPQSIALSGTGIEPTATLSATSLSFGNGNVGAVSPSQQVTLSNTGTASLAIASIVVTGANANSFPFTNNCGTSLAAGASCTIQGQFTPNLDGALTAAITISDDVFGSPQTVALSGTGVFPVVLNGSSGSVNFGSQAIGSPSATNTLSFSIAAGTTVGSIAVLTQGAPNLDFTNAASGTCTAQTYATATNCTVDVTFTPTVAGLRTGGVVFSDGSGNILGMAPIYGIGTGPQVAFYPGTQTNLGSGITYPVGVAVDASGNVFVTDSGNSASNAVKEILAAGGYTTVKILSGFFEPWGLAVDGSGNVFVVDYGQDAVYEILAAGGYTTVKRLPVGIFRPFGVAVDASGNLFVSNAGGEVYEIPAAGGYTTITPQIETGLTSVSSTAVDRSGNLFVIDSGVLKEILAAGDYTTVNTLAAGFTGAGIAAVDASENVYFYDSNNTLMEILAAGGYTTVNTLGPASEFGNPIAMAVDGRGNLYFADYSQRRVVKLDLADAPALSFASTFENQTSVDGPQTVQVQNIGNEALTITGLSYPTDFPEASGDSNACTGSTSLGAGQQCDVPINFTPLSAAALNESVTITDNALNVSGAQQSIGVGGRGIGLTTVSLSATSISFGNQPVGTTSATQQVTLTNTGSNTLFLSSIGVTGANASSFVFANVCGPSLGAGASCILHGHFTPATAGALTAAITIADNVSGSPQSIVLSGTGAAPSATLSATSLSFGTVDVGSLSPPQQATLTNTGLRTLEISSIVVTGPGASSFSFSNGCGTRLAAGASCTIHGHFAPTTTGTLNAAITISDNASDSPQSIALSGTGAMPVATLSETSLSFGSETVGAVSPSQQVTLSNTGSVSLTISSILVSGANAASFDFSNNCGHSLAAGASCTIHGHFAPTAAGALSAAITITDNAGDSPQSVALSGTGAAPGVTLSATSLSFGRVKVGSLSSSQQVTLTNTGLRTLDITSIVVTGPDASSFGFTNDCGTRLVVGASCSMHGHFAPTSVGALNAAITITDDAGDSPQGIALSGYGAVPGPAATLSATSISFGGVKIGTLSPSQQVTLTNNGLRTMTISSIVVTGPNASSFDFTNDCRTRLASGATCLIHGHFAPATSGPFNATITLTDDDADSPQSIALSGTGGEPAVTLSATSLTFGVQAVETESANQQITMTNTGGVALSISSIVVTGANASSFGISDTCGPSLAAGASCSIHGRFKPTTTGALSAAVTINDNASDSPQSIALSGTGLASIANLSATSLSFGNVDVGAVSPSQQVTLSNTGLGSLAIASIVVTGPNASSFDFSNSCGYSLAAGASCTIHGHFSPTAAGALSATITITDNAGDSPQSIALSGTGAAPSATLSATSLSFGGVKAEIKKYLSASQQVTLTNSGLKTLTISSIAVTGPNASSFDFANSCGNRLVAGASCTIHGHFSPTALGPLNAAITITDDAGDSPQSIALSGMGLGPVATFSATSLSFGDFGVGHRSPSQDVSMTNTGTAPFTQPYFQIIVTGPNASSFVFLSNCGYVQQVGQSCTIHGHFSPVEGGSLTAAITILGNSLGPPQTLALSGTGLGPAATLSATSLSFGAVIQNTVSASQYVTLTNTGNETLNIASIAITGGNASQFAFANNCGSSLAAGASCKIHGHFAPTATGSMTAAITITDDAGGSPQNIALSGTGK